MNNIYQSIAAIQNDIEFIGKDKQVQSGGAYKYRGVDQVLNTLHPLFAKHKVFAVPEVLEIMERELRKTSKGSEVLFQVLKVKYTFYAEDGTSIFAIVVGEAMDSSDKVSNKCMSVAYKYACFQILSIPTEETCTDPDDTNEHLKPKEESKPISKARQIAELIKGTDVTGDQITEFISTHFGDGLKTNDLTDEQFNKLYSAISKYINGEE